MAMPKRRAPFGSLHSTRYRKLVQKLKEARIEAGLTQMDVARAMRRSQGFVSNMERGERRIDFIEIEDLAALYGRSVMDFATKRGR